MKLRVKQIVIKALQNSIYKAVKEQRLDSLFKRLEEIIPDLADIRTNYILKDPFLTTSFRAQDAFQITLVDKVIGELDTPSVIDIGDSSGRHLMYLQNLYPTKKIRCLSINLDPKAIERITAKAVQAICDHAENIARYVDEIDIALCFETLEHLMNPCKFLHELSYKTNTSYLIITVPYIRKSRVGLHYIRRNWNGRINAENTHIFELNPEDWKLLVRHSGWKVIEEKVYYQYPRWGLYRFTKPIWRKYDFEGFLGLILKRDHTYSDKYENWEE